MDKIKDERIQIRINSEDKKKLQKRAIDKGVSLGEYVVYACMKEIKDSNLKEMNKSLTKGDK